MIVAHHDFTFRSHVYTTLIPVPLDFGEDVTMRSLVFDSIPVPVFPTHSHVDFLPTRIYVCAIYLPTLTGYVYDCSTVRMLLFVVRSGAGPRLRFPFGPCLRFIFVYVLRWYIDVPSYIPLFHRHLHHTIYHRLFTYTVQYVHQPHTHVRFLIHTTLPT